MRAPSQRWRKVFWDGANLPRILIPSSALPLTLLVNAYGYVIERLQNFQIINFAMIRGHCETSLHFTC